MSTSARLRNLWFSYQGQAQPVLRNVNLEIEEREIFVIAGQCGCGKTTLSKLMVGLLKPTYGAIEIGGVDIGKLSLRQLNQMRNQIGFLFQNSALISNMTIYDNIALPARYHLNYKRERLDDLVERMITSAGLSAYQDRLPAELSIGQRKRAAVARAMILDPKLIVYDEPTAGLDPINSLGLTDIIKDRYEENKTTSVIITHDMPFAFAIATRIAVMYRGKIIFTGKPNELKVSDNPFIKEFIESASKVAPG